MLAIVAAVLFGLALLFHVASVSLSIFTVPMLVTAGLLCVGLHLAGVGRAGRSGGSGGAVRVRSHWRRAPD